jgi:hypothetical protein
MNVRVVVFVKILQRLDHSARFLRTRSAIKINQRMPVCLLAEDWEIFTTSAPVHSAGDNLVHTIICSTKRSALPDSVEAIDLSRFGRFASTAASTAELSDGSVIVSTSLLQFFVHFRERVHCELQVFTGMRGRHLGTNARRAVWNDGIKEANDVNTLLQHTRGEFL